MVGVHKSTISGDFTSRYDRGILVERRDVCEAKVAAGDGELSDVRWMQLQNITAMMDGVFSCFDSNYLWRREFQR